MRTKTVGQKQKLFEDRKGSATLSRKFAQVLNNKL